MAYCSKCGTRIKNHAGFCSSCGVDLSETRPERTFESNPVPIPTFDWSKLNWKRIGIVGLAVVLAFITIRFGPGLIQYNGATDPLATRSSETGTDAAPNFAAYKDDFLSQLVEQSVTSVANVRNYPTSRNTKVLGKSSPGTTLSGRWVRGFDPTTKWLKLEGGGYVWEGNLTNKGDQQKGSDPAFPDNIIGTWSDKGTCTGGGMNYEITITNRTITFYESTGTLERISADANGLSMYHLNMAGEGENWKSVKKIWLSANGRSILIQDMDTDSELLNLYESELPCGRLH